MARNFESTIRRSSWRVALIALMALAVLASPALAKKPWENFDYPELGDIQMPNYERHVLENGLVVYIMSDSEWPLVEGRAIVRTGSAFEPAEKVGLASVTGTVLRSGGTTSIPSDQLDERLESMGGVVETWIEETSGGMRFSFVNTNAREGMEIMADILRHPAFEEDKIDVALTAERSSVARRNDEMFGVVEREVQKAVWGPDHPYARHTEYATLDAITRDDIVDFYEYFYHPNNMILSITGDIDSATALAWAKELFGDWQRVDNPIPDLPDKPQPGPRRVLVADKDDVTQSRFAVGQVGMKANDPDYYAMSVMNRILGGGFSDRLFNEVRSNLGLAYNVGSRSGVGWSRPGTFQAYCGTKNETTEKALKAVLGEIDKMRETEVTDTELTEAKEMILNSHVFNFVSKDQILTRIMNYEYWDYPEDFMETYPDRIRAVSKHDVQDVAERRLDPSTFAIVAVGRTSEWDGDLTSVGPVEKLDISIPEPKGEEFPPPTDETVEKGRAILASARDAMGGSALTGLESMRRDDSVGISINGMNLSATTSTSIVYPDRMYRKMSLPFGEMVEVVDTDGVWRSVPQQGIMDVGGDEAEEARLGILEDPFYILGHFDGFQVQSLESETVNEVEANVVLAWISDDKWLKMYFDSGSNQLIKTSSMGQHPMTQAPGLMETFYEDLRKEEGILMPHKATVLLDGEQLYDIQTTAVDVNPQIDGALFEKPSS